MKKTNRRTRRPVHERHILRGQPQGHRLQLHGVERRPGQEASRVGAVLRVCLVGWLLGGVVVSFGFDSMEGKGGTVEKLRMRRLCGLLNGRERGQSERRRGGS